MNRHFKFRVAYCKYVEELAFKFTGNATKKLIQSLFSMSSDSIPVVRISACKAIGKVIQDEKCPNVAEKNYFF